MSTRHPSAFSPANAFAGLIVAIVALPLCIAFAIASGAHPLSGLVSGVVGGALAALLGSSRFQVSGPAAAFIALLYGIIAQHGWPVLLAATFVAGLTVVLISLLKLGKLMDLMPHSIIVGFTSGIGVLILLGQLPTTLGIQAEGANALAKLAYTAGHIREAVPQELAVAAAALAAGLLYGRTRLKRWVPTALVVLLVGAGVARGLLELGLPTRSIGALYDVSISNLSLSVGFLSEVVTHARAVLLAGLTLGFLIAVESLLSAKALDTMTKSRHDPDRELLGLGIANLVVPFLGGIPVSGVIVRGSANVLSGATHKTAALLHSVFLGVFVVALFPLIKQLPMAALAAVLLLTALRLLEIHEIKRILHIDRVEGALVLLTTVLTVTIDLTVSVPIGVALSLLVVLKKIVADRRLDVLENDDHSAVAVHSGVHFLTRSALKDELQLHLKDERVRVLDLVHVPFMDATGALTVAELAEDHPRLHIVVADGRVADRLVRAGVPAARVSALGNKLLNLPQLFDRLHTAAAGPAASS